MGFLRQPTYLVRPENEFQTPLVNCPKIATMAGALRWFVELAGLEWLFGHPHLLAMIVGGVPALIVIFFMVHFATAIPKMPLLNKHVMITGGSQVRELLERRAHAYACQTPAVASAALLCRLRHRRRRPVHPRLPRTHDPRASARRWRSSARSSART